MIAELEYIRHLVRFETVPVSGIENNMIVLLLLYFHVIQQFSNGLRFVGLKINNIVTGFTAVTQS